MKKVLIISEQYSSNFGDGIIYDIVYKLLDRKCIIDSLDLSARKKVNNLETAYLTKNNFKKNNFKNWIKSLTKKLGLFIYGKNLKKIIDLYKDELEKKVESFNPDFVLFAGGQLFMDSFFEQIIYTISICDRKNIKVIFNACGCGKINSFYDKKMLRKIINSKMVVYISVRDHYKELKKIDKSGKVYETFDTAILYSKFYNDHFIKRKKYGIGIMLCTNISYKKQMSFWKEVLLFFEEQKIDYEIFNNGNIDDYNFAKNILENLNLNLEKLTKKPNSIIELVECINSYDKIISMRLHSLILAYSYDIPAIAVSWNTKVDEFYDRLLKKEFCLDFYSSIDKVKKTILDLNENFLDIERKKYINNNIYENINKIIQIIN